MSGAVPERIAATIFVSLMSPTTLTWIFFCLALYSSTSDVNAFSSCVPALQPTQMVRLTRPAEDELFEPPHAATAKVAATRTQAVATRFMRPPKSLALVKIPYQMATLKGLSGPVKPGWLTKALKLFTRWHVQAPRAH